MVLFEKEVNSIKKKCYIIFTGILVFFLCFLIYFLLKDNSNKQKLNKEELKTNCITTTTINKNSTSKLISSNDILTKSITIKKETTKKSKTIIINKTTKNTSNKTTKFIATTTTTFKTINGTSKTTTTESKRYIGIPDPNNFYYSIHKGNIDYKNMEECLNNSQELGWKYPIDILYCNCIEVVDSESTVLGIYLDIHCESGNCKKYKNS